MLSHTALPSVALPPPSAARSPQSDIEGLLALCRPGLVTVHPPDSMIYAQGDAASGHLYVVEFGTVRICRITASGRRQIIGFCLPGDLFGLEAGDEHASFAESVDGAGVRVLRVPDDVGFEHRLLGLVLSGLAQAQRHLIILGRLNASERMAAFLVDLLHREAADDIVELPMHRNDIADYLGLTFETVSRVLRVLKDRRIIRLLAVDRIEILDLGALEALGD